MKISIITATVDSESRLQRTVDSVRRQTYADIEHIIIDGVERNPDFGDYEAFYFYHAPKGIYEALNYGLSVSGGDVIGIVHGGDVLASPDILEKVARAFEEDATLDFIYGDVVFVKETSGRTCRVYSAANFRPRHLAYGMAPPHPSLYIRREAAEKIGKYREDFRLAADLDMWMRLFNEKSLKNRYLPEVFVKMSTGGASTSLRGRLYANNLEKLRALRLNGYPANPFKLLVKYFLLLKG